ncbi:MAG: stage 0 sporulation family protein [Desulfomonilaceae bacterium]
MTDNKQRGEISYLPRSWGQKASLTPKRTNDTSRSFQSDRSGLIPELEDLDQGPSTDYQDQALWQVHDESNDYMSSSDSIENGDSVEFLDNEGFHDDLTSVQEPGQRGYMQTTVLTPQEQGHDLTVMRITGIRFGYACKVYHFDAGDIALDYGDWVVVKTEKGLGLGQVALPPFEKEIDATQAETLRKIIRKGEKVDIDQKERCCQRETEAYVYCIDRIEELSLPMKLVSVECFFDCSKYVFYFTSEGRVDFRELVKLLVSRFPVRIEMRQIGVRHEAKMTGGIACCGQELCCSRFLTDFRPVSVKMAKNQNLSLNPTKISGVCGRLMCCLSYEHDIYEDFSKGLPKVGKLVATSKGEGCIIKHNPLEETVLVKMADDTTIEVRPEDILGELELENPKKSGATGSAVAKALKKGQSKKRHGDLPCEEN